jgi:hypothetical protein
MLSTFYASPLQDHLMGLRPFARYAAFGAAVLAIAGSAAALSPLRAARPAAAPTEITVYKSPSCGCCTAWVDHVKANGFAVKAKDIPDLTALKRHYGVTPELASCHTSFVGGYVVEGHVPADVIAKLLKEKPKVKGIAVPGMPMGSPGMEGPRSERYDVIAFDSTGKTRVYVSR